VTKVSAAFGCLLHKQRLPILEALLALDRDRILLQDIPGSSFSCLSTHSNGCPKSGSDLSSSIPGSLSLPLAALYLGNFEAFRLLHGGGQPAPNDGTLHLAAFLALPRFVAWLLQTHHDPDFQEEEFDHRIPLALACEVKPLPWCKIANEEADFGTRQRATMALLAPRTSPLWRSKGKTVLHIALENGVQATEAMLEALMAASRDDDDDPEMYEEHVYIDKQGKSYLPHRYVAELLDVGAAEKAALIACLGEARRPLRRPATSSLAVLAVGDDGLRRHGSAAS